MDDNRTWERQSQQITVNQVNETNDLESDYVLNKYNRVR